MTHIQASTLTATGDTVKTLIGALDVPKTAKKIVGVGGYAVAAATLTTGEQASGILELESPDLNLQPMQIPLDIVGVLTSGAFALKPTIIPVDIPCTGLETISGYMTMDVAQTGAFKGRWFLVTES